MHGHICNLMGVQMASVGPQVEEAKVHQCSDNTQDQCQNHPRHAHIYIYIYVDKYIYASIMCVCVCNHNLFYATKNCISQAEANIEIPSSPIFSAKNLLKCKCLLRRSEQQQQTGLLRPVAKQKLPRVSGELRSCEKTFDPSDTKWAILLCKNNLTGT